MVAFTRYGDQSRRQRKLMQQALGTSAIKTYQPLLEYQAHELVRAVLADPKHHLDYIIRYIINLEFGSWLLSLIVWHTVYFRYAGSLVLHVVYGYRVTSKDDKYLHLAEECIDILSNRIASGGGIWPVDVLPIRTPFLSFATIN